MKTLALDTSDFEYMRTADLLYVDKTQFIHKILKDKGTYYFLSRPRRFGKSLFISTLESFFCGRKEFFKGLYIEDKVDWEEFQYPVIRLNFSNVDSDGSKDEFELAIINYLNARYAAKYDLQIKNQTSIKSFLTHFILGIRRKTGKKVVLLIDEYDKPITDYIKDDQRIENNQVILRKMYDWIKNNPEYWRLVFLTGVSKFARMSVFSVLNNLRDLSENKWCNSILGFTRSEVEENFAEYLADFAEEQNKTVEEIVNHLQFWYDGYSWNGKDRIFNPYSVLNALYKRELENFWYRTGTPKLLVDFITQRPHIYQKVATNAKAYENLRVESEFFKSKDLSQLNVNHLLYHTGYLTIHRFKYVDMLKEYFLTYPNHEVRWSFTSYLLSYFYEVPYDAIKLDANYLRTCLQRGDIPESIKMVRRFFDNIPHELRKNTNESYYHSLFQMLMMLIGVRIKSEESGSEGRADAVLQFHNKVYIIEFKYAKSGSMKALIDKALKQIKDNRYAAVFEGDSRPILSLGIGFLEKKRKGKVSKLEVDGQLKP